VTHSFASDTETAVVLPLGSYWLIRYAYSYTGLIWSQLGQWLLRKQHTAWHS